MTEEELETILEALDRVVVAFGSMSDKVWNLNPSWAELNKVLTPDEAEIFWHLLEGQRKVRRRIAADKAS